MCAQADRSLGDDTFSGFLIRFLLAKSMAQVCQISKRVLVAGGVFSQISLNLMKIVWPQASTMMRFHLRLSRVGLATSLPAELCLHLVRSSD